MKSKEEYIKNYFDHRYVMTVKKNSRLDTFYSWAKNLDIQPYYGKTPEDFPGQDLLPKNCLAINFKDVLSKVKPGEKLLYFEDDAIPQENYQDSIERLYSDLHNLPEDWDFYMPGYLMMKVDYKNPSYAVRYKIGEDFLKFNCWYGLHAFCLNMTERTHKIITNYIKGKNLNHVDFYFLRPVYNRKKCNVYFSKNMIFSQDLDNTYSLILSNKIGDNILLHKRNLLRKDVENIKKNSFLIDPEKYHLIENFNDLKKYQEDVIIGVGIYNFLHKKPLKYVKSKKKFYNNIGFEEKQPIYFIIKRKNNKRKES